MGHSVFNGGGIAADVAEEAAEGLAQFSLRIKDLSITRYRAVATSAVRESPNRRDFVRRVRARAGLRLEVISGSEEIRLVHAAVRRRLSMGPDPWVLVELGGGSVEIALANDTRVIWCETHAMGAVRLLELFARSAEEPRSFARLVEEYVATIRLPPRLTEGKATGFIATGGNIEALVRAKTGGETGDAPARLTRDDLHELTRTLSRMSVEERMRAYQLRPDRADVIVPAAIVYEQLADMVGADGIYVPGGGIREGIVFELMERLTARKDSRERNAVDDAATLGRKYNFDEVHARHVAHLASELFDQLRGLHGLGVRDRRLLAAAAVLHDVGDFVSFKGHHKHSLYLISRSELAGFTPTDMFVIGNIARYHRKGPPSVLHPDFALLPRRLRQGPYALRPPAHRGRPGQGTPAEDQGPPRGREGSRGPHPCRRGGRGAPGAVGAPQKGRPLPRCLRPGRDPRHGGRGRRWLSHPAISAIPGCSSTGR